MGRLQVVHRWRLRRHQARQARQGGLTQSWLNAWFGRGFVAEAARALYGEDEPKAPRAPIRQETEEEIRADERRYDEDAKRLDDEDAAAKRRGAGARSA
jgi:hypothetical protein